MERVGHQTFGRGPVAPVNGRKEPVDGICDLLSGAQIRGCRVGGGTVLRPEERVCTVLIRAEIGGFDDLAVFDPVDQRSCRVHVRLAIDIGPATVDVHHVGLICAKIDRMP